MNAHTLAAMCVRACEHVCCMMSYLFIVHFLAYCVVHLKSASLCILYFYKMAVIVWKMRMHSLTLKIPHLVLIGEKKNTNTFSNLLSHLIMTTFTHTKSNCLFPFLSLITECLTTIWKTIFHKFSAHHKSKVCGKMELFAKSAWIVIYFMKLYETENSRLKSKQHY